MKKITKLINYFTTAELILWTSSIICIITSAIIFSGGSLATVVASLIGVTALIFNAKGNPLGPLLIIIFSIFYGIISLSCRYYGETITYLGMSAPMAVVSLISWLKNPYKGNKSEVAVNSIKGSEVVFMLLLSLAVTLVFYFILKAFNTANIIFSTISVTTSFAAVYLTFRRSPLYAVGYALNDIVLIVLWSLATIKDFSYFSVIICFIMFFANDIYGFINWQRMQKRQASDI